MMMIVFFDKNLSTTMDEPSGREWTFTSNMVYCKEIDTNKETAIKMLWVVELKKLIALEQKELNTLLKDKKLDDKRRRKYRRELREYRRQMDVLTGGIIAGQVELFKKERKDDI